MVKAAVAFDVLGTCFSFDGVIAALEASPFGPVLVKEGVSPRSVILDWFHSAQRDFTYLSICGQYTPISEVLKATIQRALANHLPTHPPNSFSQEGLDQITSNLKLLKPEAELQEALELLKEADIAVWAVTNGGAETSRGYYERAGLAHLLTGGLISCDDIPGDRTSDLAGRKGFAKPTQRVYTYSRERLIEAAGGGEDVRLGFIAAHQWDLVPAKQAGFLTGYTTHEELVYPHEPNIFAAMGPDVVGTGLVEVVKKLIPRLLK